MQSVAEELGMTFLPDAGNRIIENLSNHHLFSEGGRKKVTNLLKGRTQDVEVCIFDYKYSDNYRGNSQSIKKQTVIYFTHQDLDLPQFEMRPENIFHKIGSYFGMQDIDFDNQPGFSSNYLLKGRDEEAVRSMFTDEHFDYFSHHLDWNIEGNGKDLVIYEANERQDPEDIKDFFEKGLKVMRLFINNQTSSNRTA